MLLQQDKEIKYNIFSCDDTYLSKHTDELVELCHKSFKEHSDKGLSMMPCSITKEKFQSRLKGSLGMCVKLEDKIIGFWFGKPKDGTKVFIGDILAIDPEFKGRHIGQALSLLWISFLKHKGFSVFRTDTSMKSLKAVTFHKSYGCRAVEMRHFNGCNYRSVILEKALIPEKEISAFEANRRYFFSSLNCKFKWNANGEPSFIRQMLAHLKSLIKRRSHDISNQFLC